MPAPTIRRGTAADVDLVADIMTDSFANDPVIAYLLPPDLFPDRDRRHRLMRQADIRWQYLAAGEILISDDDLGALLWKPPGTRKPRRWQEARAGLAFVRAVGPRRVVGLLRDLESSEKMHPKWPHGYIGEIGVRREAQGKGVGSALLKHALAVCDAKSAGAYLESSNVLNLPLYRRFGFEVVQEMRVGKDGPTLWLMWRQPVRPEDGGVTS